MDKEFLENASQIERDIYQTKMRQVNEAILAEIKNAINKLFEITVFPPAPGRARRHEPTKEWALTNCLIWRSVILGRNKPVTKQIYISKLTRRYRVLLEESFTSERPEVRNQDRHWYEIIPCQGFKPGPQ